MPTGGEALDDPPADFLLLALDVADAFAVDGRDPFNNSRTLSDCNGTGVSPKNAQTASFIAHAMKRGRQNFRNSLKLHAKMSNSHLPGAATVLNPARIMWIACVEMKSWSFKSFSFTNAFTSSSSEVRVVKCCTISPSDFSLCRVQDSWIVTKLSSLVGIAWEIS